MLKTLVINTFLILSSLICFGQKESNSSSLGIPIFIEDFGNANTEANKSDIGDTSYKYVKNNFPNDGSYTISSKFDWLPLWFNTTDHTPKDKRGKALIVNADQNKSGVFFSRKINNLCPGSTYEFSAWLLNIFSSDHTTCDEKAGVSGGIPINVRFEIWDESNSLLLKKNSTGKIYAKNYPQWKRYNILFQTLKNQETIILKIANNGQGGCGNDLALDDIQFAAYGDKIDLSTSIKESSPLTLCSNYDEKIELKVSTENTIFKQSFFQWQYSTDGEAYTDIINQKKSTLNITEVLNSGEYYYRVKVAGNINALSKPYCSVVSEPYKIEVKSDETLKLFKELPIFEFLPTDKIKIDLSKYTDAKNIKWYDSNTLETLIGSSKKFTSKKMSPGNHTLYAVLSSSDSNCPSTKKIPVKLLVISEKVIPPTKTQIPIKDEIPEVSEKPIYTKIIGSEESTIFKPYVQIKMCLGDEVVIDAGIENSYYDWNTEEYEKTITVYEPGKYVVTITKEEDENYLYTRTFYVKGVEGPSINRISVDENNDVKVHMREYGSYEYSSNGEDFQKSNIFKKLKNGPYQFFARDTDSCQATGPVFRFIKL